MVGPDVVAIPPLIEPEEGKLTLYVGGPGFGECQVAVFPDGRVLVVDACIGRGGGTHFPLDLLAALEIHRVDLLVVTHDDLDHCSGVARLLDELTVDELWHWPPGSFKDLLARMVRENPAEHRRLAPLHDALEAIDEFSDDRTLSARLGTEVWPSPIPRSYEVHCIAPCYRDEADSRRDLVSLVEWDGSKASLAGAVERYLGLDSDSRPGLHGNVLSLGLTIIWEKTRIVLGGDIESPEHQDRGWNGIIKALEARHRLHLLRDSTVVKVAHHGSKSSFSEKAWNLHTSNGSLEAAIITPFQRHKESVRPPHAVVLESLMDHTRWLGLTAEPVEGREWVRVTEAGWTPVEPADGAREGNWLAISFSRDGSFKVSGTRGARWFRPSQSA